MHNVDADLEKKAFSKKYTKQIVIGCLVIIGIIIYVYYWAFINMGRLPRGEFLSEAISPDGKYTLRAYGTSGGATTSYAIRGELVLNVRDNKTKNIYWNIRENTANISWSDNDTVIINGHIIDVPNGKYDFRNQS
ncbi:hypothetical protein GQF01_12950 [Paenibacillus sp. 5J-6]|uniref:DUF5412 domain-containing protein n=1 Tax=Paenibacillus silvestris TaxID=2606219 RepID=A0A6L8UYJ4_9BACL|nr:hypothetical protein [Paenibacillus silvestris]